MKKSLTIEDLKNRVGKPVFVIDLIYGGKNWRIIKGFRLAGLNTIKFTDCNSIIDFENIQLFRFFDTEVSDMELKEILDAEEKENKKTGYERVEEENGVYYSTDTFKEAIKFTCVEFREFCNKRYDAGNYFNDEKLCENIARAEQLKYKLRRYAASNGGIPSPKYWQNLESKKNYISYDCVNNKLSIYDRQILKEFGQIYFKNKEACEKAIEIFKDELIWYFTEFEEQLY